MMVLEKVNPLKNNGNSWFISMLDFWRKGANLSSFNRIFRCQHAANLGIFGHGFEGLYSTSCTSRFPRLVMWSLGGKLWQTATCPELILFDG